MPKYCEKYYLDRDLDPHFFSGIDGSLFEPNEEKLYPNSEYCVDYFYFKDELDPEVDLIRARFLMFELLNYFNHCLNLGGDVRVLRRKLLRQ